MVRLVENIGRNIVSQLKDKAREIECVSFAFDESTDVSDTSQLLLFIRGTSVDSEITEEQRRTRSFFAIVEKSMAEYHLNGNR